MLLWNRLNAYAASQPDKIAVTCGEIKLTYREFAQLAEGLAQSWLRRGYQPGDRIALHLRNGIDLAACYYACFASGCVAVPINSRLTTEEIAFVLENSGARGYVSAPELRVETTIAPLEVNLGKIERDGAWALAATDPDAVALLLYTSGTTARPKGVVHTQRTLAGNCGYMEAWGLLPTDHTLLFTAMVHASGSIMLLMSSLWMGASVTIVPVFDAGAVLDTWERSGASFFMTLPTFVRALIMEQRSRPRNITTGRLAIAGGDTVPVSLQEDYLATFGHLMVEGFGMTEGLPTLANHPDNNRPGAMGRPVGDTEIRIVDGELLMRGPGIALGYWGYKPFDDGWLKTGDLVEQDTDGFVWFRGRKKEIIVRGGSNIAPQEVEETIYKHPSVAECGVIGETNEYWGEVVIAFVARRPGHSVTTDELISFAKQHLAEYKCPERIVFLDVLPKGPTGKVQRRALQGLLSTSPAELTLSQ